MIVAAVVYTPNIETGR